ncbi:unnamed protein product [Aphis gossypii]|uniref:Uncharacterized protein n=2 Tax=Aphis gossypii TaxID=80765 RepID=A0A9P0J658_APHGO|nr:unnamed protein product [Aphis gossypii]
MSEVSGFIDEESIKGRFGWILIEGHPISMITRIINGEHLKFVSVLMAEMLLIRNYLHYFNPDIYKCFSVKGYYITNSEAKILNYINKQFYSSMFHEFIAGKDCIVRLEDAQEFYKFVCVCYNKIQSNINDHKIQFGCIKFFSRFIPYYTKEGQKYLPLFYFTNPNDPSIGDVELKNWDLAYLKFCFKVMGIFDQLYNMDSCTVISLNNIKNYYPSEKVYEDFWPEDVSNNSHIINLNKHYNKPGVWITNHVEVYSENTLNQLGSSFMPQKISSANNNTTQVNHSEPVNANSVLYPNNTSNIQYDQSTSSEVSQQQQQQQIQSLTSLFSNYTMDE